MALCALGEVFLEALISVLQFNRLAFEFFPSFILGGDLPLQLGIGLCQFLGAFFQFGLSLC